MSGADGSLHLNSRDWTIVQPGSQLIFVARGVDDTLAALPEPYEVCDTNILSNTVLCVLFVLGFSSSVCMSMSSQSQHWGAFFDTETGSGAAAQKQPKISHPELKVWADAPSENVLPAPVVSCAAGQLSPARPEACSRLASAQHHLSVLRQCSGTFSSEQHG